jgi:hypothetical protein
MSMTTPPAVPDDDAQALESRLQAIVGASWMSQAAYVAAQLKLPDLLAEGPKTSAALAEATGSHAASLHRLLRALTTIEIVQEGADGAYVLTPLGALLRSDAPGSLRSWTLYWGGHQWRVWGHLLHSVKTGESARRHLLGTQGFEYRALLDAAGLRLGRVIPTASAFVVMEAVAA